MNDDTLHDETLGDEAVAQEALTPEHREFLRRRTILVLAIALILASAATTGGIPVAFLIVEELLGSETWAGLPSAANTTGAAIAAIVLAKVMNRSGRRPGLRAGYVVGAMGAVGVLIGVISEALVVILVSLLAFGAARATNLLARFAAADLATDENRAKTISFLVWTTTIGSVTGPLLVGTSSGFAESLGLTEFAGPYLFAIVLFAASAVVITMLLRPDPLVVIGGLGSTGPTKRKTNVSHALRVVGARPHASLAMGSMMAAQAVMSAVMVMTPSHMNDADYGPQMVGFVFSAHIFGMYGLSPLVGMISDRLGRIVTLMIGMVLLVAATVLAALAGSSLTMLFPALFLLGIGWNFGLIAGSALLTETVPIEDRVTVQGTSDMLMTVCGGAAGLSSGVIKAAFGYSTLGNVGTALALVTFLAAVVVRRLPIQEQRALSV